MFYKDSEAAFGAETVTRRGSFGTRIRWGKAVAAPGVRGRKMEENYLCSQDPEAAFGTESATREARFGPELDGVKLWRRQVFGARMREKNGRKPSLFSGSRAAFGTESATGSFWTRI